MKAATLLFSFVAIFMAACTASRPKEQSHATKPATVQAPKAAATMKDSTPMQRPVAPDTTTKYTEEDGGMTQIESKCIKGLEVPFIYGRLGHGLTEEASKPLVAKVVYGALGKRINKQ